MPLTPFHFGPGTLAKAIAPKKFSLRAFILVQIVIDIETAWNIFFGGDRLHTYLHTYVGSLLAIAISVSLIFLFNLKHHLLRKLRCYSAFSKFTYFSTLTGLVFGAWSHVYIDSIMHADMLPYWPMSELHPQLAAIPTFELHVFCVASLGVAFAIFLSRIIALKISERRAHKPV